MQTIRVAVFQRQPIFDDIARTASRLRTDLAWSDEQGVDLAVFPECFLQGYTTAHHTIAGRALRADGAAFHGFLAMLPPCSTDIILGFIEQRTDGFYNSAAVISGGAVTGIYVKNHPNERAFLPGHDAPVFSRAGVLFGINICADANFPACARRLSTQGARLICYPLNNMLMPQTAANWRHRSLDNLRSRAIETGCWVASSDVVGTHGQQVSHGCTCIIDPQGVVVARVAEGVEGVAVFEVG